MYVLDDFTVCESIPKCQNRWSEKAWTKLLPVWKRCRRAKESWRQAQWANKMCSWLPASTSHSPTERGYLSAASTNGAGNNYSWTNSLWKINVNQLSRPKFLKEAKGGYLPKRCLTRSRLFWYPKGRSPSSIVWTKYSAYVCIVKPSIYGGGGTVGLDPPELKMCRDYFLIFTATEW